MPELGKYAAEVLSAWGVSLALLGGIVLLTLRRNARTRARLEEVESRRRKDG